LRFDDGECSGGAHLDAAQAGRGEQGVEFGDLAFPAACHVEHVHVHQGSEPGLAGVPDEEIDDGDTASLHQ
jgi:hypothetical protein